MADEALRGEPAAFRFAPSPNGHLHLGHAFSALLNQDLARRAGGRFLLRIEDIDTTRCRPEYETAIIDDLGWLGLDWERPVRRQSDHFSEYAAALDRLKGRALVFPCFCTRGEIAAAVARVDTKRGRAGPRDPDHSPLYPGTCRDLPLFEARRRIEAGEPHALRLAMADAIAQVGQRLAYVRFDPADGTQETVAAVPARCGDVVLARKDVPTSYHLSVVLDDAIQGVTHVVRGRDLEAATDVHRLLQAILNLPVPRYHHHRLIEDATGLKLAKSAGSTPLRDLREQGVGPADIRRALGF